METVNQTYNSWNVLCWAQSKLKPKLKVKNRRPFNILWHETKAMVIILARNHSCLYWSLNKSYQNDYQPEFAAGICYHQRLINSFNNISRFDYSYLCYGYRLYSCLIHANICKISSRINYNTIIWNTVAPFLNNQCTYSKAL